MSRSSSPTPMKRLTFTKLKGWQFSFTYHPIPGGYGASWWWDIGRWEISWTYKNDKHARRMRNPFKYGYEYENCFFYWIGRLVYVLGNPELGVRIATRPEVFNGHE